MARKPALSHESLASLGADKLAALLMEEVKGNAALKKRLTAAIAGGDGAEAVAKVIDRRLSALERARAMVAWEKERALAQDLGALVASITGELAPLDSWRAVERLVRFLETHVTLFERIDDSSGRIQNVYWKALDAVPELLSHLPTVDRQRLPALLTSGLLRDTHGLSYAVANAAVPFIPADSLVIWDAALAKHSTSDDQHGNLSGIRMAIADARDDLDGYLALEEIRPTWKRNPLAAAERLLNAGRLDEALVWVRKEHRSSMGYSSAADVADGRIRHVHDLEQVRLEARILEAKKDRPAAQILRWSTFSETLEPELLREYIAKLDDFEEFDEMDRAVALVMACPHAYAALNFLIKWPLLDKAEDFVLQHAETWQGRHYDALVEAAAALEHDHPLAATVLIRALLNDILDRAKSQAYGYGARYLAKLAELATRTPDDPRIANHPTYVLHLKKNHGRKTGFWGRVE